MTNSIRSAAEAVADQFRGVNRGSRITAAQLAAVQAMAETLSEQPERRGGARPGSGRKPTAKHQQALALFAKGMSVAEVAKVVGLSESAVRRARAKKQ